MEERLENNADGTAQKSIFPQPVRHLAGHDATTTNLDAVVNATPDMPSISQDSALALWDTIKDKLGLQDQHQPPIPLPIVPEARFDSKDLEESPKCHEKTRPDVRNEIQQCVDDANEKISLRDQFDTLIYKPLSSIQCGLRSMLIIIDGLDECTRPNDIPLMLKLFASLRDVNGIRLRVLLTSRQTRPLTNAFTPFVNAATGRDMALHEEFLEVTRLETRIVLTDGLADIKLDQIYELIMSSILAGEGDDDIPEPLDEDELLDLQLIVGSLVLLLTPLPTRALQSLLSVDEDRFNTILDALHAVVRVPDDECPVELIHKSFADYVLGNETPGTFNIDQSKTHDIVAERCINRMPRGLRKNICNVGAPLIMSHEFDQETVARSVPPDLAYACMYWVYHTERGRNAVDLFRSTLFKSTVYPESKAKQLFAQSRATLLASIAGIYGGLTLRPDSWDKTRIYEPRAVAISPDGKTLAACSHGQIIVADVATGVFYGCWFKRQHVIHWDFQNGSHSIIKSRQLLKKTEMIGGKVFNSIANVSLSVKGPTDWTVALIDERGAIFVWFGSQKVTSELSYIEAHQIRQGFYQVAISVMRIHHRI
ncbi:uncharacterized protein BKA55DRAFT_724578 [Fusarium redolens]|uniref:Nephrocystin 3-like N-terminal domain-containing protein n=1 Tax=Fusarium redolens TaxID=48865 RepID=A0A9P9KEE0_FUSRE|nr:uncharacterized protein BKA55DRAFT_724578 [Fusarium redolens]KAH7259452.1 hypothetical protein BKA55DRAFT_724578 [Fusarium redolens]